MAGAHLDRRLLAILAADVVGYSHLMEADEEGTIARLRQIRTDLAEPLIAEYKGRLVKLMGDGALVAFESVVDAVVCAIEIQKAVAQHEAEIPGDRRIVFRIGVNLGDVALIEDDVYGDGVNVAARLEQSCEPGGVLVSGTAFDHLWGKLDLPLEPIGELKVKNIERPVRAYRVRLAGARPETPRPRRWRRFSVPAVAALLAPLKAIRSSALGRTPSPEADRGRRGAADNAPASPVAGVASNRRPAPDRPAVAVLPFETIGEDASIARLAVGVTDDVITDLARFRGLDVIARNSAAVYKDRTIDRRRIGRDLDVQYIVEGSIQRHSEQIRVRAQLVDVSTGGILWSERWDRLAEDVFAIQSELATQIAATLGGMGGSAAITAEEMRKAKRRPPANLTAYDQYLLANEGRTLFTGESVARGLEAATKAIALDPNLSRAYVARAWLNYIATHYGAEFETAMQAMEADARHALSLDPNDAEARVVLAHYLTARGRFQESEAQIRAALQANPANAQVLVVAAAMQACNGKPEEAAELADRVMRLDPWMTAENLNAIKDAYFFAGRFEDVIAVVSRIPVDARGRGARLLLTLSYALLGRTSEAAKARADLLDHYPTMSAELLLNLDWAFARREEEELFLEGFRAAGLPICAADADLAGIPTARRLPECAKMGPAIG
ncbi:hypothetical protein KXR53_20445 [Inquilinus limosus]|uniref:adenylate/guanylate cyclase domain-containing protein n=1 Tax=Inquilinus limosus TaxID=171674 RepID=UPI003F15867D